MTEPPDGFGAANSNAPSPARRSRSGLPLPACGERAGVRGDQNGSLTLGSASSDPRELYLLSAGAAQSVVAALIPVFAATTGTRVRATFRAVGALKEELLAGVP